MPPPTRTKIKPMTDKALILRVILETIAILLTSIPLFYLYVINTGDVQPFKRGFFCDDENLKHPYSEEQIPDGLCALIWVVAVVTCVVLVEGLTNCVHEFPQWSAALMKKGANKTAKIPRVIIETYRILGYFAIGALFCTLTTELAKYNIGRLRPYFLTVCKPDMSDDVCKDINGYQVFVTDYDCHEDADIKMIREARKSFLSGHSSFSFYSATFLIMYLHARLSSDAKLDLETKRSCTRNTAKVFLRGFKILRPFIQFGCFSGALFVSLTRITDNRHHPTDVIVGILVGLFFASLILLFLADLFNRPRSFQVKYDQLRSDPEDMRNVPLAPLAKSESNLDRCSAEHATNKLNPLSSLYD